MAFISESLIDDYFLYRESKGVKQTISSDRQTKFAIQSLNEFIHKHYQGLVLRDLRPVHIRRLIDYQKNEKNLKESTITTRLVQLRGFFTFCQDSDLIEKDPLVGIETPKIIVERVKCIKDDEWKLFMACCKW